MVLGYAWVVPEGRWQTESLCWNIFGMASQWCCAPAHVFVRQRFRPGVNEA